jgi:hypothetical protein
VRSGCTAARTCCSACEAGEVEIVDVLYCPFCSEAINEDDLKEHLEDNHTDDLVTLFVDTMTIVEA